MNAGNKGKAKVGHRKKPTKKIDLVVVAVEVTHACVDFWQPPRGNSGGFLFYCGGGMQDHEKTILELIIMGGLIGIAKVLVGSDQLTFRLVAGRAVLGSATSMVAGLALLQIPDLPPIALLGLGSALGIIGSQYFEVLLRRNAKRLFGEK
nr:phage holin family protein [Burkholderia multivorans]